VHQGERFAVGLLDAVDEVLERGLQPADRCPQLV
jgi:hypothetical protein